jgi:hypothetical protein
VRLRKFTNILKRTDGDAPESSVAAKLPYVLSFFLWLHPYAVSIRGWKDPRSGHCAVEQRKICCLPRIDPGPSIPAAFDIPTEVSRKERQNNGNKGTRKKIEDKGLIEQEKREYRKKKLDKRTKSISNAR